MTEAEELHYLRHMVKQQELQLQGHAERYQGFIEESTRIDQARCNAIAKLLVEKASLAGDRDRLREALEEMANGLSSLSREAMEQIAREALMLG